MKALLTFISFSFFLQTVLSLGLIVQPNTFVAHPSLLFWTRQPADGNGELDFDLRFVEGVDKNDAGMAVSGIHASPTQQYGTAQVVFPTAGTYAVIAVTSPNNNIGISNNVNAIVLPSAASTVSATPTSTTSTSTSTPTSSAARLPNTDLARSDPKIPVIIGSIVAASFFFAVLAMLVLFFTRRPKKPKRWTFHRDMMVQSRRPPPPIFQACPSVSTSASLYSQDIEQGLHTLSPAMEQPSQDPVPRLPDPVVHSPDFEQELHTLALALPSMQQSSQDPEEHLPDSTIRTPPPVARPRRHRPVLRRLQLHTYPDAPLPQVPIGPRSPLHHHPTLKSPVPRSARAISPGPRSPLPRSPSPRTHRQRAIADQIEILRIRMLEMERAGEKDDVAMDEMCEKLAWLREKHEGPWALGLTEVTPLGYDRYLSSL